MNTSPHTGLPKKYYISRRRRRRRRGRGRRRRGRRRVGRRGGGGEEEEEEEEVAAAVGQQQQQQTEESLYHIHISFKGCLSCSFSIFFHHILAWKLHPSLLLHTHYTFSQYYSNRTPVSFVELYTYRENFIPLCFTVLHANMNLEHVLHMLWEDAFKIHLSPKVSVIKCKSGSHEDGHDRSGTV